MKTAVITDASSSIGSRTAMALARSDVRVVLACRSVEQAQKAREDLLAEVPDAPAIALELDLSELASIREFADRVWNRVGRLDLLVSNSAVKEIALARNSCRHELQLATNYLGPFALTGLLLPLLRQYGPGRIVYLGNFIDLPVRLEPKDLNWERTPYDTRKSYAMSQQALLCFTLELDRRLRERGSGVAAVATHPDMDVAAIAGADFGESAERRSCRKLLDSAAHDVGIARQLWEMSESMTGVEYLQLAPREGSPRNRARQGQTR